MCTQFLADRAAAHTVCSANVVYLSVRPSVCLSVTKCTVAPKVVVESWKLCRCVPTGHFLFTASDTFAVGCIVQPQRREKANRRNFRVWNSHGQRGHVTAAISDAAFSAFLFCSNIYVVRSTIGLLVSISTQLKLTQNENVITHQRGNIVTSNIVRL